MYTYIYIYNMYTLHIDMLTEKSINLETSTPSNGHIYLWVPGWAYDGYIYIHIYVCIYIYIRQIYMYIYIVVWSCILYI